LHLSEVGIILSCRDNKTPTESSIGNDETPKPVPFGLSRTKWRLQCINASLRSLEHSQFLPGQCWHPAAPRPAHQLARLRNTATRAKSRPCIRCGPIDSRVAPTSELRNTPRRPRERVRTGTHIANLLRFRGWSVHSLTAATRRGGRASNSRRVRCAHPSEAAGLRRLPMRARSARRRERPG
jgi:hypothetical protein